MSSGSTRNRAASTEPEERRQVRRDVGGDISVAILVRSIGGGASAWRHWCGALAVGHQRKNVGMVAFVWQRWRSGIGVGA